ncbi:hypothetical protein [Ralstonia phage phiRSL1]|uniref:Uncharacterized protein n=1 Tax=Ralstonia phage phiRSL1 TaxID=1980924 RepID=B2ZXS0_9CAUD|nr:hypothetical protein RSL1_ORF055 [Ralstonia phage phiRSL1]BAG41501.1 hypothetical protein [Ralstonia phage phiRSL1]
MVDSNLIQTLGNPFPATAWDPGHPDTYLFYEGPLLWRHTLPDGRTGFVHWADRVKKPRTVAADSASDMEEYDQYNFYMFQDRREFEELLTQARLGRPLIQIFAKCLAVYQFLTLSNDTTVRSVKLLEFPEVDPATLPAPDANIKEES